MKRGTLIGIAVVGLSLLPAWAVKSATTQNRISWTGFVLFFAFIGAVVSLASRAAPAESAVGPYVRRYRPYFLLTFGLSFLVGEFLAIAFTYAEPGVGLVGKMGLLVSQIGSMLFPVIAKYETAMEPPLSSKALFRAQSIMTVFMMAGIPSCIAYLLFVGRMPDSEQRQVYEQAYKRRKPPSVVSILFCILFAILVMFMALFGWLEFDKPRPKGCIMQAICYTRGDDLLIFTAALLKVAATFGSLLGVFSLYNANRALKDPGLFNL